MAKMDEDGLPRHRKLYELLRKSIEEGLYSEGNLLPSENELCRTHRITRPTVRMALSTLETEGYILKRKGKGSIVCNPPRNIGILSIQSTTNALGNSSLRTQIIRQPEVIQWPSKFAFALPEEYMVVGCIYFERLRLVDDVPIFYDITYMPNINLPRFTSRNLEDKSLFDLLRSQYQIEIKGGEQRIRAIMAPKQIALQLNIRPKNPVLQMERCIETNRAGFVFYSFIYGSTEHYALSGRF